MTKKRDYFNDCLERIRHGEELDSCLQDYPEEAEELRVLLSSVSVIKRYAETVKPRPDFIAQTEVNLVDTYEYHYLSWKAKIRNILKPVRRFAVVTTIALVVLVGTFILGLTLSVLASEDTMPGETLYTVKLATEQVRLIFTFSDYNKIDHLTQFTEKRVTEIVYATNQGDTNQIEAALKRLERNLAEVEEIITPDKVSSVIAASDYELQELERIESTIRGSYIIAQDKLKEIREPNLEKKEKTISRIYEAYSKAIVAVEAAKAAKTDN